MQSSAHRGRACAFGIAVGLIASVSVEASDFVEVTIDAEGPAWSGGQGMHAKCLGDFNGDGLLDPAVAGSLVGQPLVWYESPAWTRHTISTLGGWSTDAEAGDIDRDGDVDLVISSWYRSPTGIEWFENGNGGTTWTRHFIGSPRAHDLSLADFDLDGDLDIVTRDQLDEGAKLQLWRQNSPLSWTRRTLTSGIPAGEGLTVGDMDADGDEDIVIGRIWLENTRNIMTGPWTIHQYTLTWSHLNVTVATADLDRDGRRDVVLAPSEEAGQMYHFSWFRAPPDPKNVFAERLVAFSTETVLHSLQLADFDLDGHIDILTAEMHQSSDPDNVMVYFGSEPVGGTIRWARHVVSEDGAHNMQAGDMNGDGAADFFGPDWTGTRAVTVWLNECWINRFDFNHDQAVNMTDIGMLISCSTGPSVPYNAADLPLGCFTLPDVAGFLPPDLDRDRDVDADDFARLQRHLGPLP